MTSDPNAPSPKVETGDRRAETHYEADADQQVRVAHLIKPDGPLPREDGTTPGGLRPDPPGTPVADVKLDTAASSVWDARPPEDRAFQDVPAAGPPQASPLTEDGEGGAGGGWPLGYLEDGADADGVSSEGPAKPPFPPSDLVSKRAGG